MKRLLIVILMTPLICGAVEQPKFDSATKLLTVPSVMIDGIPSSGVLRLFPDGTYQVLELKKLDNCPASGQPAFSPINYNCGYL